MTHDERITRINELAKKSRETKLDENELAEQKKLRLEYVAGFKRNMKAILDDIEIIDDENPPS